MRRDILMPALSPTMETGKLAKWHIKEGDTVSAGDVIAEIETDKALMEVEAVDEGEVVKILVAEGAEDVKVNTPIAAIEAEDGAAGDPIPADAGGESANSMQNAPEMTVSTTSSTPSNATPTPAVTAPMPTTDTRPAHQEVAIEDGVETTVREALRDAMAEEMRRDDNVFIMGEEVAQYQGAYKVTQGLLDEFGARRVIDTPITEHGFAGIGVGAAFAGLRPIVEFMTFNFSMQAIDQIINSAAKTHYMSGGQMRCPIVFRGPNGAAARVAAQHSQDFSAWYSHIPGLKVVAPWHAADAKGLLKSAIRDENPVVFLENEILYGKSFNVPEGDNHTVPIGLARVVRTGADVTLISFSIGMTYVMDAVAELVTQGIDAEVIDLRTLRPLDMGTVIESVKKTNRCVIVEEGWPQCSIGSEISARLMEEAFDWLDAPVHRIHGKDVPMPYAANLEKLALPSVTDIVAAAKAVLA